MKGARNGLADGRRMPSGQWFTRFIATHGLVIFLAAILIVVAILSPAFLKIENLLNVATQAAPLGMVVIGQTFVLLLRGLDLSVASVMATSAVIATGFNTTDNRMMPAIFATCILLGLAVGAVNGFLVAKRKVSPFLATLATMIVLQGLRFLYTQGSSGSTLPSGFTVIGQHRFLGLPINVLVLLAMALVLGFVLRRSPIGRRIYLVGGNPRAAALVGINTDLITIGCYMLCGSIAAIAGLFLVGYVGMVDQWTGKGYELDSIVAAVMGGVAISGGRGSISGALLGVVILIVMFNMAILLGLPVQVQYIIKGVIVIVASAFYASRGEFLIGRRS
jgi:ribose/xylose/arabinose/galactoside ABC-type transport system permease subunit